MWNCPKCRSEVDDGIEACWSCGTSPDGRLDPTFQRQTVEVVGVAIDAAATTAVAEPPVAPAAEAPAVPEAAAPAEDVRADAPTAWEILRALESQLSNLMDAKATADWKVNPAFHPDVNAFIQEHANNSGFTQKARGLQQNRAKFYAKMRELEQAPKPVVEAVAEAEAVPVEAETPLATPSPEIAPARPAGGGRRILLRLAKVTFLFLFLLVGLGLMASVGYRQYGKKQMEDAISETNKLDPSWQWASLQVNRVEVADDQNAALVVLKTAELLQPPVDREREAQLAHLDPLLPLSEEHRAFLAEEREMNRAALEAGQPLATLATGRFPDEGDPAAAVVNVADLFHNAALRAAEDNLAAEALAHCRRSLNAARSVGDDPVALRQLLRLEQASRQNRLLERVLARTTSATAENLAEAQKDLEGELSQPVLKTLLRGWRAKEFKELADPMAWVWNDRWPWGEPPPVLDDCRPVLEFLLAGEQSRLRAENLRALNDGVALADLSWDQLADRLRSDAAAQPSESARVALRHQALLLCAATGLAAERYRLANQEWPRDLDQLVPQFLDQLPLDPYDGKPLRWQRGEEGLVIYSVGPDLLADGENAEIRFRLFDVARRRPDLAK